MKAVLSYPQHDRFVDPARRSSGLNHTLVGFVAIEFFYAICRHATDYVIVQTLPDLSEEILSRVTARAMIIDLFAFLFLGLTVIWVVWRTHNRGPATLFGPASLFWSDLLRASLGAGALFLVLEFVLPWWRADHVDMQPLQAWAATLPLALMALLIQTGAEELFYRGYLQQQFAARFSNPLVWMTLPNLIFAAVHWYNGSGFADSATYVLWAFCFGVAASDLVARSGSIGAAIGFHLANNAYAFLMVGERGAPDSGLALFLYPPLPAFEGPEPPILSMALAVDLMVIVLAWLAVRVAIRR
ncbi:CPBP family intramembrane glutamic endopeptidase [Pseudooceanicola atlanticus]|uniref:CPBP family intramembrane glutamic endopeptidase n=1 Tax=Pseudooceanicola atlanticus TaxID=1461694 RepID=UPI00069449C3|nr:CPBP family intramembrane glutamic endopeptidase [Pseudooceanicola atlanticus]